uniref:3-hydroxyacyl-CoA dehydrogenase n=1 Tax=uncultured bacterium 'To-T 020 P12' TaxID=1263626 RepID=K9NBX5_9BACT|nr:3-hydroxyacyl-CoA dehydrogenase [uncultured bacterium 'To-T 020 P12']
MAIRSAAVLGAGVMGAQIAAHFANVGVPVLLMDLTGDAAAAGLTRAMGLTPDPFFTRDAARLIETASFDHGMTGLAEADWIVEAVVERLDVKAGLLAQVDARRRHDAVVSSNTSGIPIAALAAGRTDSFRRHWLGTHFFNPPRYLRLLEVIPTEDTDPAVVGRVTEFADWHMGKAVVLAKDSPNFIGNHLALYEVTRILELVAAGEYSIEEVDAITGPAIGRPRSATFRTLDLAGVDILGHVVENLRERLSDREAARAFALPAFVQRMLEAGLTGEKAGQGFYKRVKGEDGQSQILVIDPQTLEYGPLQKPSLGALAAAEPLTDLETRVRRLFGDDDRVGRFLRRTLAATMVYAARVTRGIAHSPDDIDRVMQWGFGWERGPFELMDAIGVREVLDAARAEASAGAEGDPPLLREILDAGRNRLRSGPVPPAGADLLILRSAKDRGRVVQSNAGTSLVDLGDGVLAVEFHSKMNAIGGDAVAMLQAGVREASRNFQGLVIGNEAPHFSVGANLMLVLLEAQDENWDELDHMVRSFQQTVMLLRGSDVPVVVAPAGLTLGGACELSLHADRLQAAAETYMGLVEAGVGLIPAGGGTKEMVARAAERAGTGDLLPAMQHAFETIGFGKTSTSGADARRLGFLRPVDGITMNRERQIAEAKARVLQRVREGYQPPVPRHAIPVGGDTVRAPLLLGVHLAHRAGRISDHDALIGRTLATVMAGGLLPHATTVPEQRLLDLEREAFLSLLGEPKTQQRIQHTLKTGKPLRN